MTLNVEDLLSKAWLKKKKKKYALSSKGLAKLRRAAVRNKPWLKSTGPRTSLGKAVSRMNAMKHGLWSKIEGSSGGKEWAAITRQVRKREQKEAKAAMREREEGQVDEGFL